MQQIYDRGHIPDRGRRHRILYSGACCMILILQKTKDDPAIRQQLERLWQQKKGQNILHQKLAEVDPKSAEDIHANNVKRVVRALEFYQETGTENLRTQRAGTEKNIPL